MIRSAFAGSRRSLRRAAARAVGLRGIGCAGLERLEGRTLLSIAPTFDLSTLDGLSGFTLFGVDVNDSSGVSVSSAGDVNGDGFGDLIIGAGGGDGATNAQGYAGETYVVFGRASFSATPTIELSTLDGITGFTLFGVDAADGSGGSVSSAGDVNGDGFGDLIIGADNADGAGNAQNFAGETYVVFGRASFAATPTINLSMLDGVSGFTLFGVDVNDNSGRSVSCGDVNGDGFSDLIIGAFRADGAGNAKNFAGETYVVFGKASFAATPNFMLSTLDGGNGFTLFGVDAQDQSGVSVSSADVNGDGFSDLIIGAYRAGGAGNAEIDAGETYVVFGKPSFTGTPTIALSTLNGSNGFTLFGADVGDSSALSVSSAGDVNGDGFDDMIIGARYAERAGDAPNSVGESYVVFGRASFAATAAIDLGALDGVNGFTLFGVDTGNYSGGSVSTAGDFNGDGFSDLIIGDFAIDDYSNAVKGTYVVFGRPSFAATPNIELSMLDGTDGFALFEVDQNDSLGNSVSFAGDVNGDGFSDLIIGAPNADAAGNARSNAGESYVIFGAPTAELSIDDVQVTEAGGAQVNAVFTVSLSHASVVPVTVQFSVSADTARAGSDFTALPNGTLTFAPGQVTQTISVPVKDDGFDEPSETFFVNLASPVGATLADDQGQGTIGDNDHLLASLLPGNGGNGLAGFTLFGVDVDDESGRAVSLAGDVNGDGFGDVIIGARFADGVANKKSNSSDAYVVFGRSSFAGVSTIELSTLNGTNGFTLFGVDAGDYSGISVSSAGDFNGDGFGDLVIGAYRADGAGASHVVFGRASFTATPNIDLSTLNGANGFTIAGVDGSDNSGFSVASAGDVNGDGLGDLIIGAYNADAADNAKNLAGETYVVFGKASFAVTPTFDLATLLPENGGDGSSGFILFGVDANDESGFSVSSAGDVNGDGFGDVVIGARGAFGDANADQNAGETYVFFGKASFAGMPTFDLSTLDGTNGFTLFGADENDSSGVSVSAAGDVNGDGFGDLIIGAFLADGAGNAKNSAGDTYVVFGKASFAATPIIELSSLNGTNGFTLLGADGGDASGFSVSSAGDVNGDGFSDLIIGASAADGAGNVEEYAGETHVLFGRANFAGTPAIDLSTLNGTNGFTLFGVDDADISGFSVSDAGDVNGDGFGDLIIGAPNADAAGNARSNAGETYVVFGRPTITIGDVTVTEGSSAPVNAQFTVRLSKASKTAVTVRFATAPGSAGAADFTSRPLTTLTFAPGQTTATISVAVADDLFIEGDETFFVDLFSPVGAILADAQAVGTIKDNDTANVDLASLLPGNGGNGLAGFTLFGVDAGDFSGVSAATAGDVNGDGFADLIIGAHQADGAGNAKSDAGDTYVVFGRASFAGMPTIELSTLNGTNGFTLFAVDAGDRSGFCVASAGDVNGDGFGDLVIGANSADGSGNAKNNAGETYVVFGKASFAATPIVDLATLNGTNGFTLFGVDAGDRSGYSVASAGDVNGDGFGDLVIGAPYADGAGNAKNNAGETYVVFGKVSFAATPTIELSTLNGTNGFTLFGVDVPDYSGGSVASAGDVNGDGFGDLVIGAPYADGAGNANGASGETYVVFGKTSFAATPAIDLSTLNGTNGFTLFGVDADDRSGVCVASAGDVNGDGFGDLVVGALFADGVGNAKGNVGETYVVFGRAGFTAAPTVDLATLDGTNGFTLLGVDAFDQSGASVSAAGDVNGDGFGDLIIGMQYGDSNGNASIRSGESYVVYGKASFAAMPILELSALDGADGFTLFGVDFEDYSARVVSSAGDVNGDGFDDLILAGAFADGAGNAKGLAGETYVVLGKPSITIGDVTVTEGSSAAVSAQFTVTLSKASPAPVTVRFATAAGTAGATDFTSRPLTTLTFAPGQTTATISVPVANDLLHEGPETFVVDLFSPLGATLARRQAVGTILDNDALPTLSVNDVTVTEGNAGTLSAVFTVRLSAASGQTVTVNAQSAGGTATSGADFNALPATLLTFLPGQTSKTVTVQVIGDVIDEDNQTFFVNLSDAVNAAITDGQGLGTITDNDAAPTIRIDDVSVLEPDVDTIDAIFMVTLSGPSEKTVTVNAATGNAAGAANTLATEGVDFTAVGTTPLTFNPGVTALPFAVTVLSDGLVQFNERFAVNLTAAVNAAIADAQGIATIQDIDAPAINIADAVTVVEPVAGTINLVFNVTLSEAVFDRSVTVNFKVPAGTTAGTAGALDITPIAAGTVTFAVGETSKPINVVVKSDLIDEADETVTVMLTGSNFGVINDGTAVGTIQDSDAAPTLSVNDVTVTEGNTGTVNATFTVRLSAASGQTVMVNAQSAPGAPGAATSGVDFVALPSTPLTFLPGETSKTVTVQVNGDVIDENDQTFFVNLSSPVNATIADGQGVGTIVDNDAAPTIRIDDATVVETDAGAVNAIFRLTLSGPSEKTVTVNAATGVAAGAANTLATAGQDFEAQGATEVSFSPGTITTFPFTVPVQADNLVEFNEKFAVNLTNAVNATIADNQGIATIMDDDAPAISIADAGTVFEPFVGTANMTFNVTLSQAATAPVTVNFRVPAGTLAGTASALDITPVAAGILTFAPGEVSKPVNVVLRSDLIEEPDETVTVLLTGSDFGSIIDDLATGAISDGPSPPEISVAAPAVTEGNSGTVNAIFTISLSKPTTRTVTVNAATSDGTALSGLDYVALPTTRLTFLPGQTSTTVTVPIKGDTIDEDNQTFFLNLSSAVNATGAGQNSITIIDNDAAPTIRIDDVTVMETDAAAVRAIFTVSLSAPSDKTVTVFAATGAASGAANTLATPGVVGGGGPGADFDIFSATLTFTPGVTAIPFAVTTLADNTVEFNERFAVNLTTPVNATIADAQAIGTIQDDDAPAINIADAAAVLEPVAGTANMTFNVTLSAAATVPVTVNFKVPAGTTAGTASALDITPIAAGILTFAPGETSKPINVVVKSDLIDEADETVAAMLTGSNFGVINDGTATGVIQDSDAAPTLSVGDVTVIEGDLGAKDAVFTITLSAVSGRDVKVNAQTVGDTAASGTDFTALPLTTLTIPAGQKTVTVTVPILGDTLGENSERFFLNLTNPVNATIADGQGIGTITSDEFAPDAIAGLMMNAAIASAAGGLPAAGNYQINFAPSGGTYTVVGNGFKTPNATGTFTYTRTGKNTGRIDLIDDIDGPGAINLTFTSITNATYALTQGAAKQNGAMTVV